MKNTKKKNHTHCRNSSKVHSKNRRNRGKIDNSSVFIRPAKWVVMYTCVRGYWLHSFSKIFGLDIGPVIKVWIRYWTCYRSLVLLCLFFILLYYIQLNKPQVIKFTSYLRVVGGSPPGNPASSTTKTSRHDIAEILPKVVLKHKKSKQTNQNYIWTHYIGRHIKTIIFLVLSSIQIK